MSVIDDKVKEMIAICDEIMHGAGVLDEIAEVVNTPSHWEKLLELASIGKNHKEYIESLPLSKLIVLEQWMIDNEYIGNSYYI